MTFSLSSFTLETPFRLLSPEAATDLMMIECLRCEKLLFMCKYELRFHKHSNQTVGTT